MNDAPSAERATATLRRGVRIAPGFRQGLGLTVGLAIIGALGRIAAPVMIQQAIDNGLEPGRIRVDFVTKVGVIGLIVIIVAGVSQRTAVMRLGLGAEDSLYALRVRLFEHVHRLSIADHVDERKGALVSRVTSDIETLSQFFSWSAISWLLSGAQLGIVAIVMLAYDWMLALVAFAVTLPLIVVLRAVQKRLVRAYDTVRTDTASLFGAVGEMVTAAEMLRAYDATDVMAERVKAAATRRAKSQVRGSMYGSLLFPSGEVFGVLAISAVVLVGVLRGPGGGLSAGSLIGFVFFTYRFLEPIAEFTEVIDQTQTAVAGFRRILGLLDTPVGPPESETSVDVPSGRLDLRFEGVTFGYRPRPGTNDSPEPALRDVSLRIASGERVAIVGATGSGKSTLALLIARFADPTTGVVRLGGVDLRDISSESLRQRVTLVPQSPFLFDGSIESNLMFARPGVSLREINDAVDRLGLRDWLEALGDGLDSLVGERGEQLSAGERQLVALIRASLAEPDVLVLDEATSSVDPLTEVRSARAMEALSHGRTTIAIAHRLSTAARAERILVMAGGRIVEDGDHATLSRAGGAYQVLYEAWLTATSA